MPKGTCTVAECDSRVLARGYCSKHYSRWYKSGDPLALPEHKAKPPRAAVLCSIDGCDKAVDSREMCSMHYVRWQRHGDPLVNLRPKGRNSTATITIPCSEDNCELPARTGGLCALHYRNKLHAARGECSVEGCTTTWHVSGLCLKHYHRMRSHGTTDDPRPAPLRGSCTVDLCDEPVKARGMCGMHLRRFYRTGSTDAMPDTPTRICSGCKRELPADAVQRHHPRLCERCRVAWKRKANAKVLPRTAAVFAQIKRLREEQGAVCAICGTAEANAAKGTLHADHVHGTDRVRGLLCSTCNTGIGMFRDRPDLLAAAIEYLKRTSPDAVSTLF